MFDLRRRQAYLPHMILVLSLSCAACTDATDSAPRPAPPETAEPAPAPNVTPAEDRGHQAADAPAAASAAAPADDGTFSNVESGESERAASNRGHASTGEPAPGSK